MTQVFVFYAPSVHTGGGFVLLRALLAAWPVALPLVAFLDARAREQLVLPHGANVSWVTANVGSRLKAEFSLYKAAAGAGTVLCFHGLPPLLPSAARVVVFLQNRLYLERGPLPQFKWKTRFRLAFERFVSRVFRHRVSEYIVQTPAMQRAVMQWYSAPAPSHAPMVKVMPFVDAMPEPAQYTNSSPVWDFVYIADGGAHKNHRVLLAAWRLLAQEGLRPTLALTLGPGDDMLRREVKTASEGLDLQIHNLGQIPHEEVLGLYSKAHAMIFPSISESFGLPLMEAAHAGLPILASELDYVRDVCTPAHTFDPSSPVSVARAVKRFLGRPEPVMALRTPGEFWRELLRESGQ